MKKLSNEELLVELEAPFPVDQVLWRVTNTANNRTRGQVVPYADPRAYTALLEIEILALHRSARKSTPTRQRRASVGIRTRAG
jgi:hypothetical protein